MLIKYKKKIAYVINHTSFFTSHILPLAEGALRAGYDVKVFCGKGGSDEMEIEAKRVLKKKKIKFLDIGFLPASKNIFTEVKFLITFMKELKKYKPDIIHGVSLKGVLYSCIYSNIFKVKKLICFITGMGYFFTNRLKLHEIIIKYVILFIIKITLKSKNTLLTLENKTDKLFFMNKLGIDRSKIKMFNGAGVDLDKFFYDKSKKKNIVLFPARVLIEKGINEFLQSAKVLSLKYPSWKFNIAGTLNYKKNQKTIIKDEKIKNIKFLGYHKKIYKLFNESSIVCLPSYREGFPKSLIEASGSGCAIVTTNVPGCRDAIINNFNGYLCKPRDIVSLSNKLDIIISDKKIRNTFEKNSRKLALNKYSLGIFVQKNLKNYNL
jgi:glycosyltransferase involved in cell wall biosynthesis